MGFLEKVRNRIAVTGSRLCVGLDPRPGGGVGELRDFLARVIAETLPYAAAFKPNLAYFEAFGSAGLAVLEDTLVRIPAEVPVILDGKRGDIGETQRYYAKACFETWRADAATVNPFLGFDSIEPFLAYPGKAAYLLALTSNPGSADIQRQPCAAGYVFNLVAGFAGRARAAGLPGTVGFVVGLTNASPEVFAAVGDAPLLVPGLGAQGGDLANLAGRPPGIPDLVNVSRGILYAEPEKSFARKAHDYANQIAGRPGGNN
jgi:orotidine-5'-phosphate decarboxylase